MPNGKARIVYFNRLALVCDDNHAKNREYIPELCNPQLYPKLQQYQIQASVAIVTFMIPR